MMRCPDDTLPASLPRGAIESSGGAPTPRPGPLRPLLVSSPGVTEPRPTLSVVIPTWNGRELLADCLPALERSLDGLDDAEVLVADHDSSDGTGDWLEREWPGVRLVPLGRNAGFAGAANAGAEAARGD